MNLFDLAFPAPEENLACDEALLDWCDAGDGPEALRFWEPQQPFVVVGYANQVEREVNVPACRESGIAILRRCSGGGAVVQGPGCLNYALVVRIDSDPSLQSVTGTNQFVMDRNRAALEPLLTCSGRRQEAIIPKSGIRNPRREISVRGHTDLAIGDRKFSGNAQRRRRHAILFHGTFLLNLDLALVSRLLLMPSKQPDYRHCRSHGEFLMNLDVTAAEVKTALTKSWGATVARDSLPSARIGELARERYSCAAWNLKLATA